MLCQMVREMSAAPPFCVPNYHKIFEEASVSSSKVINKTTKNNMFAPKTPIKLFVHETNYHCLQFDSLKTKTYKII